MKYILVLVSMSILSLAASANAHQKTAVIPFNGCSDPGILPENICVGVSICGVAGTKLCASPSYGTVTSANNRVWLDRNLGASRVATSATDTEAYGDLYQWGRPADGHESRTSKTYTTLSDSDVPGHGSFILTPVIPDDDPYDWRTPQNDNLWQGLAGTNNPCPAGFRVPTKAEWETEITSWSSSNSAGAFASPLKLVLAGDRTGRNPPAGNLENLGHAAYYWSSDFSLNGTQADHLYLSTSEAYIDYVYRVRGCSVRCIKD